jgi:DNA-binding transcriptional MerR regulator
MQQRGNNERLYDDDDDDDDDACVVDQGLALRQYKNILAMISYTSNHNHRPRIHITTITQEHVTVLDHQSIKS